MALTSLNFCSKQEFDWRAAGQRRSGKRKMGKSYVDTFTAEYSDILLRL